MIALTGGHDGPLYPLARGGRPGAGGIAARGAAKSIFGDRLYVALERHGMEVERAGGGRLSSTSPTASICRSSPPTSPSSRRAEDFEAHDALLAIAEGRLLSADDRRRLTPEHHFASRAEMMRALRRPARSAREHRRDRAALPHAAARRAADPAALRRRPRRSGDGRARGGAGAAPRRRDEGLARRLAAHGLAPGFERGGLPRAARVRARRHRDDEVSGLLPDRRRLHPMGEGAGGSRSGPGRGSGAGSVVAWALTITDLDPLRFGLLFERFLNPDRVSMPDFDIDFCQDRPRRGDRLRRSAATAPTASRRSSPSARCRRAPRCATSAACWRCRTGRSTGSASWCRPTRPIR